MTLPPYNPSAKCIKCGSERVDTSFHGDDNCATDLGVIADSSSGNNIGMYVRASIGICRSTRDTDHMLRHCSNCGFEWLEAPMDKPTRPLSGIIQDEQNDRRDIEQGDLKPTQYPFSGYAFGRYQLQGKGGPKHLKAYIEFRDMTEEQALQLKSVLEARWPIPDIATPMATSFYQMSETWRLAVDKQPQEIKDQIFADCDRIRELNGWTASSAP